MIGNYKVITLCGSTRFKDAFLEAQKRLTLEGNVVISVGLFGHSGDAEVWEGMDEGTRTATKEMLDDMHRRKIDMADEIYVINVGGYIGESTQGEIEYAKQTGKRVRYLEPVNENGLTGGAYSMENINVRISPYPIPKDSSPLYLNTPSLIDPSFVELYSDDDLNPDPAPDNVRFYIPLDVNHNAILRRLEYLIYRYGEANEGNEVDFALDVDRLITQIHYYDRVWYVRHMPEEGSHSAEGIALAKDFIELLKTVPDGCAERFPFETIEELQKEYLV